MAEYKHFTECNSLQEMDLSAEYSYFDYMKFKIKERVELIKGKIYELSAPRVKHQSILGELHVPVYNIKYSTKCKFFLAPFDVRLPVHDRNGKQYTLVQPDICIICDASKLDEAGCNGAPDLVVQILCKSSVKHNTQRKFKLYQEAGVKEYWIVYPDLQFIDQYVLDETVEYQPIDKWFRDDVLNAKVIDGLSIDLSRVFEEE